MALSLSCYKHNVAQINLLEKMGHRLEYCVLITNTFQDGISATDEANLLF